MLSSGAQTFVLQFAVQKYEDQNSQNCNFVCCFAWVKTWSLKLREQHRLRVYEYRVLRKIFGPNKDEVTGELGRLQMRSLIICATNQILFARLNQDE
jgi:hypothetical protein